MKILVFGAAGNLGKPLCEELSRQNHEVFAVVRPERDVSNGLRKISMDLRTLDVKCLPRVDEIIYLAQSRKFREFPNEWEDIFDINIRIPLLLADWARKSGCSGFHYASSGGVYESGVLAVHENMEINANRETGFYIGSRLSAEVLLRNFAAHFARLSLIRPFFVYGPQQARNMLIPRLVDSVMKGSEITLSGPHGIRINPIHVKDAAKAFTKLIELKGFHALNVAGPQILSLRQIAEIIGEAVGRVPVLKVLSEPAQDLIGNTALMEQFLYKPQIHFADGIKDLIR